QSAGDQPVAAASGLSLTMSTPSSNSDSVRPTICASTPPTDSRASRGPSPSGTDMPATNRNAGKTRSTNVMPLPSAGKGRIQRGTIISETPAMSLTKIMAAMTRPRVASMEAIRGPPGGPLETGVALDIPDTIPGQNAAGKRVAGNWADN